MADTAPVPKPGAVHYAIICALPHEGEAVELLFDVKWRFNDICPPSEDDDISKRPRNYVVGMIGHHHVVLVYLPKIGKTDAAAEARNLTEYFKKIHVTLVVGICAINPDEGIHFGDAIISTGLVEYDSGKQEGEKYVMSDEVLKPDSGILGFLSRLRTESSTERLKKSASNHLANKPLCDKYKKHPFAKLQKDFGKPSVHFGYIASGGTVIKSEKTRIEIFERCGRFKPIAYEMEGAGVEGTFRGKVVVIKSAVDHADEKKHKKYQPYADLTAAAYMKAFLDEWDPPPEPKEPRKREVVKEKAMHCLDKVKEGLSPPKEDTNEAHNVNTAQDTPTSPQPLNSQQPVGLGQTVNNHNEPAHHDLHESRGVYRSEDDLAKDVRDTPHRVENASNELAGMRAPVSAPTEASVTEEISNSQASKQKPLNVNIPAAQSFEFKKAMDLPELSPTMSTASTYIGSSPRGEVEEVKPTAFSSDKDKKPLMVGVAKIKSESHETQELFKACEQRDINEVKRLLKTGEVDPCALNSHGQTMLHVAIGSSGKVDDSPSKRHKIAEIITALCKDGARPNDKDKYGIAPIHYCVKTMNMDAAKRLISLGANVNLLDNKKRTALNYMAADGYPDEEFTEMLIREGARRGPLALPKTRKTWNDQQWAVRDLLEKVGIITVN